MLRKYVISITSYLKCPDKGAMSLEILSLGFSDRGSCDTNQPGLDGYRCNSFIVDLRHKFTVGNMNEIPVFVRSSELGNRTWPVTWVYDGGISPIFTVIS